MQGTLETKEVQAVSVFIRKNHKKILIIDDEAPMRELLQLYLHAEGYSTESAAGGKEALSRITVADFDLVILDLMMPIMDGFDVCKAIRQISTVPIIMLTAREETVDKVVGLKIGADDYLTKPFEHQELIARMESIFGSRLPQQLEDIFPLKDSFFMAQKQL